MRTGTGRSVNEAWSSCCDQHPSGSPARLIGRTAHYKRATPFSHGVDSKKNTASSAARGRQESYASANAPVGNRCSWQPPNYATVGCLPETRRLECARRGKSHGRASEPEKSRARYRHSGPACTQVFCCRLSMAGRAGQAFAWPVPSVTGF